MNVASLLDKQASLNQHKTAVIEPKKQLGGHIYKKHTFNELHKVCNRYANTFKRLGIKRGTKVLTFVTPSFDFPAITFALFKIGAVPIMIDPGMGVKNLLKCVEQVKPSAMVGVPKAHILKRIFSKSFKNIDLFITTGKFSISSKKLKKLSMSESQYAGNEIMQKDDLAAILFTSGGTGIPKGVEYTHHIFLTQTQMLKDMFNLGPQDTDLPGFPLFALFTLGMGMKIVIPDMNPSRPAKANPERLIANIRDQKTTFVAGSPAIWEKVADYCLKKNIELPSVKHLVMFGAPVSLSIHEKFKKILPNGDTYTPYGATECLPVSCISGTEILSQFKKKVLSGGGVCVGRSAPGVDIYISKITDDKLTSLEQCGPNEIGEICVLSDTVTPRYFEMPEKTNLAKIETKDGLVHRMGDVGYLDDENRLWFCGRKDHRVELEDKTLYSIPCESFFNQVKDVKRTALVKFHKNGKPNVALVVERLDHKTNFDASSEFSKQLLDVAKKNKLTQDIDDIFYYDHFPVDVRHNIKIDRKKLGAWVQEKMQ